MVCSTEVSRHSSLRLLAALQLFVFGQGCATAQLLEAGRRTESVLRYEAAYTDGRRLWLVYDAQISDREGRDLYRRPRSAAVELADLDPAAGYAIDALPLERAEPPDLTAEQAQRVALRLDGEDGGAALSAAPSLVIQERSGQHAGFTAVGFEGLPNDARFYSGALSRPQTAVWVYPALPFALAWDAAWAPVFVALAGPYFLVLFLVGE